MIMIMIIIMVVIVAMPIVVRVVWLMILLSFIANVLQLPWSSYCHSTSPSQFVMERTRTAKWAKAVRFPAGCDSSMGFLRQRSFDALESATREF